MKGIGKIYLLYTRQYYIRVITENKVRMFSTNTRKASYSVKRTLRVFFLPILFIFFSN